MTDLIRACPACGHDTIQAVGGVCTVIVPGPEDGPIAIACGCDCYRAMTGKSHLEEFAELMWGPRKVPGDG